MARVMLDCGRVGRCGYAPDYIVNAGGIINVCVEYLGEGAAAVEQRVRAIPDRLISILQEADAPGRASNLAADDLARRLMAGARQ